MGDDKKREWKVTEFTLPAQRKKELMKTEGLY